jgi:uncharacterized protein YjbJ (UPF0337 family)
LIDPNMTANDGTLAHVRSADCTTEPKFTRHGFEVPAGGATDMNSDTLKGQWTQLKGSIREQWGKLTNDDLDQIQGHSERLIGKIQERYGMARDEAERQVNSWKPPV